jgi:hypothetical protein
MNFTEILTQPLLFCQIQRSTSRQPRRETTKFQTVCRDDRPSIHSQIRRPSQIRFRSRINRVAHTKIKTMLPDSSTNTRVKGLRSRFMNMNATGGPVARFVVAAGHKIVLLCQTGQSAIRTGPVGSPYSPNNKNSVLKNIFGRKGGDYLNNSER